MPLPKNVKPEDVMHPDGTFYRNPTHIEEAIGAADQSQLVKAISGAKSQKNEIILRYTEDNKPWDLPGFAKFRELSEEEILGLCKSLMRYRQNIFRIHIQFGRTTNAKKLNNTKVRLLSSSEPRFHTEVAGRIADILSDQSIYVCDLIYEVQNADSGNFSAVGEVYYIDSKEEWESDEFFQPAVSIDYFQNA